MKFQNKYRNYFLTLTHKSNGERFTLAHHRFKFMKFVIENSLKDYE